MDTLKQSQLTEYQKKDVASKPPVSSCNLPSKKLILEKDGVHVWRAKLDLKASQTQRLKQTLSADEHKRAERFYFQIDRDHFIVAHGLLRIILGYYLERDPYRLEFKYNPYRKPYLADDLDANSLRFNLSHSQGLALYAITQGREIGIDVEHIHSNLEEEKIAEQFFSPLEITTFRTIPNHMKKEAFYNCWTRKEAFIKATGKGLSTPLDQFDVSLTPGKPAVLLNTKWDYQEATRWSLQELNPGPGYIAALCTEGHVSQLICLQWSGQREKFDSRQRLVLKMD